MWLDVDVSAVLAWQAEQAMLCPGCGYPRDESFHLDGPGYEATPLRCRACEERDVTARQFRTSKGADMAGMYFPIAEHR